MTLFIAGPLFPNDGLMSVVATFLVGALGFLFSYSLIKTLCFGLPAFIILAMGFGSAILSIRQKQIKLILKSLFAIGVSLLVLFFIILSNVSLRYELYSSRKELGITLPKSARVHFIQPTMQFVGTETEYFMKMIIAKEDLPLFLQSEPFGINVPGNQIGPNDFYIDHPFLDGINALPFGWNPDVLKNCWGVEWTGRNNSEGDIFVDVTNSKRAIVYLRVFYW